MMNLKTNKNFIKKPRLKIKNNKIIKTKIEIPTTKRIML